MKKSTMLILAIVLSLLLHTVISLLVIYELKGFNFSKKREKPYFVDVIELPKLKNKQPQKNEKHKIAANVPKKGVSHKFSEEEKIPLIVKRKKKASLASKKSISNKQTYKKQKPKDNSIPSKKPIKIEGSLYNKNFEQKDANQSLFGRDREYQYKNSADEATVSIGTQSLKYASYMKHVKDKIQNTWIYPEDARLNNQQGELLVLFSIEKDGRVKRIKLIHSSGYSSLDNGAIQAIKDASPFPKLPDRFHIKRLNIYATFLYSLNFYYIQ
jgi:protein TonB